MNTGPDHDSHFCLLADHGNVLLWVEEQDLDADSDTSDSDFRITSGGMLSPTGARSLAAALLTLADEAEAQMPPDIT